ncbi:ATP-dependent RNA helicase DDX51 [Amphibalanus amphitrite]|uniref:ATP-dependent RNA helicase n=1 Tax=Amphibalanus amphitrite TaxID=1232801 RepID=A0A6A4VK97_AMPAM|nr:ATP-dependent RNA helicase DDX51 [Amphibalanus amphitrite]KAF0312677.1 ATP-dependent RNA helicase DDX51 [Amphibalanus amphitrite]
MADLTERTAAAAVANNDSEDTSESDGDAAADDFTVLDEGADWRPARWPAPANLPALCPELRARLAAKGIEQVFLVQVTVLPELLAAAESPLPPADLCVSASAGRGKTLAFVLPLVQARRTVPAVFRQYDADTPLCVRLLGGDTVARGGTNWWRWGRAARSPWLIVVSTPGWLLDHITSAEGFSLAHLRYLVIDEADRVIELA